MNRIPNRKFSLSQLGLAAFVCFVSASCGRDEGERSAVDVGRLSTDVHVSIAQQTLVLPFIALEDYAYRQQSFSFDRKGDAEHALDAASNLLRDTADPKHPLAFDGLTVVVRTYGWNDSDIHQIQMCPLLTREWARSVCDNPWAAIRQALPGDRFMLVDLRRLQLRDPLGQADCVSDGKPRRPLPKRPGEAAIVCAEGANGKGLHAVVRIDGDLGAQWTVWRDGPNGETAEAMTEREGKAIFAFVRYGLGKSEDFPVLHATLCHLRRPGSADSPKGADCANAALPAASQKPN